MPLTRRIVFVIATIGALIVAAGAAGAQTSLPPGVTALSDIDPATLEVVDVPAGLELRVRSLPGTDQTILATLPDGALVRSTGGRALVGTTTWFELNLGGTIGWSSGSYLSTSAVDDDAPAVADLPGVTTLAAVDPGAHEVTDVPVGLELRVRVNPGVGQAVITTLPNGTIVRTTGARAQVGSTVWLQLDLDGTLGWSSSSYLTQVEVIVQDDAGSDPDPVDPADLPGVEVLADIDSTVMEVTGVPTGLELRLRAGPGTNQTILDTMPEGTAIVATGRRAAVGSTTWYEVVFGTTSGWSSGAYLTESAGDPVITVDPEPQVPGVVVLETVAPSDYRVAELPSGFLLNVRIAPGVGQAVVARLPDGDLVAATGRRARVGSTIWLELDLGNETGWSSSVYLTEEPNVTGISSFSEAIPEGRMTVVITDVDVETDSVVIVVGGRLLTMSPGARIQDADGSSMTMAEWTTARDDVSSSNPLIAEVTVTDGVVVALRQTAMI